MFSHVSIKNKTDNFDLTEQFRVTITIKYGYFRVLHVNIHCGLFNATLLGGCKKIKDSKTI